MCLFFANELVIFRPHSGQMYGFSGVIFISQSSPSGTLASVER